MTSETITAAASGSWTLGDLPVRRIGFGAMRLTGSAAFHLGTPSDRDRGGGPGGRGRRGGGARGAGPAGGGRTRHDREERGRQGGSRGSGQQFSGARHVA
ncbi:hypothetical protein ACFWIZ_27195, partial [Streptomyces sp. NPDC127044]